MKKIIFFLVVTVVALSAWDKAKVINPPYFNNVQAQMDGDTLWLKSGSKKAFKVRLIGLDTFETKVNHRAFKQLQTLKDIHPFKKHTIREVLRFGHEATVFVKKRVLGKTVEYQSYGVDRYKRKLVYIKHLNYLLIRNGLAVQYPTNKLHQKRKSFLLDASREANLEQLGIYEKGK